MSIKITLEQVRRIQSVAIRYCRIMRPSEFHAIWDELARIGITCNDTAICGGIFPLMMGSKPISNCYLKIHDDSNPATNEPGQFGVAVVCTDGKVGGITRVRK